MRNYKNKIADAFHAFARNGRWGTCVSCPRDSEHNVFPEFCQNTDRYDHNIGAAELAETFFHQHDQRNKLSPNERVCEDGKIR